MELCVVGAGYVGLVAAACLADLGHRVAVVERDPVRLASLEKGGVPVYEPGLAELLARGRTHGRLRFGADAGVLAAGAEVVFVAVGTPGDASGRPATADVEAVLDAVGPVIAPGGLVVLKSTVPVGTADAARARLRAVRSDVEVVSNPEFLSEGNGVRDFTEPDRIVLGWSDPAAGARMERLYAPYLRPDRLVLHMDNRSAELAKYAANLALAARVSLMNELARLCEATGADIERVREVVGADHRVGSDYLFAGAGFGGSCLPKDLAALAELGRSVGEPTPMVDAVRAVNAGQRARLLDKLVGALGSLPGRRVAVWGLAYKPGTDDVRASPALALVEALVEAGAEVVVYDPKALGSLPTRPDHRVRAAESALEAARGADALVVMTEWPELSGVDLHQLAAQLTGRVLVDGRNIFDPGDAARAGLRYMGVGRAPPLPQDPA